MNINFGLLDTLPEKETKKKERNILHVNQALQALNDWIIDQTLD
jgi:folate-dependent tRNA-U54 methylase TrmFO/GidA